MSTPRFAVFSGALLLGVSLAHSADAQSQCWGDPAVCFPNGVASFADSVIRYAPSCNRIDPQWREPALALGAPDHAGGCLGSGWVSLGNGGVLEVMFKDNDLSNSGTYAPDLCIWEIGAPCNLESFYVAVRPATAATANILNSLGFTAVDPAGFFDANGLFYRESNGQTCLDLDAWAVGLAPNTLHFDAVRITDNAAFDTGCSNRAGADIDAVGALTVDLTPARRSSWGTVKLMYR